MGSGLCVQTVAGPGITPSANCQSGVDFSSPCDLQQPNCSADAGCVRPHVGSSSSYCVPNGCLSNDFCVFGAPSDQCQTGASCMQFSPAGKCLPQQCTVPTITSKEYYYDYMLHVCNPMATHLIEPWSCCADPDAICTTAVTQGVVHAALCQPKVCTQLEGDVCKPGTTRNSEPTGCCAAPNLGCVLDLRNSRVLYPLARLLDVRHPRETPAASPLTIRICHHVVVAASPV